MGQDSGCFQPQHGSFNWFCATGVWNRKLIPSLVQIDSLPFFWAVHRLGGIVSPANAAYSASELKHQLLDSKATALFTCAPLLSVALEAAAMVGLPKSKIYLIDVPQEILGGANPPTGYKTVSQLAETGKSLPALEPLKWAPGEGARRTAFLCYSSGTSGLPVPLPPLMQYLKYGD